MLSRLPALLLLAPLACSASESCDRSRAPVSEWVRDFTTRSESVFYGTVTRVEPPPGAGYDVWIVSVQESYKGSFRGGPVSRSSNTGWGVLPGESAVFFLDASGRLLPCSSYQHYLTDFGAINEVRHVLRGGT